MSRAPQECDVAVVGAGILGLAVARELTTRAPGRRVAVLERESDVATEQTGHNSGVIHAGTYYEPGSLKARMCVAGARAMYEFCEEHGIRHERCGKLIVARYAAEVPRLDELERRGRENGVPGLRRLSSEEIKEIEPHARGVAALHSPATGIVDFRDVARALAVDLHERGGAVTTSCVVAAAEPAHGSIVLRHAQGQTRARFAVFCAGVGSDRLAAAAGAPREPRIVPFRGAYLYLRPERGSLVRAMIYPVPDANLPFLGVHLTRHVNGRVSLGPSALLWTRDPRVALWPGTLRLARRWWRTGLAELHRAASPRRFASAAAAYVPELTAADFEPGFAGVRAQALARDGTLVDDFVVSASERALHVRNAPSPAATSALELARLIADRVDSLTR
jgi:(S)-2-hydroxyglutarate dehydrogenase